MEENQEKSSGAFKVIWLLQKKMNSTGVNKMKLLLLAKAVLMEGLSQLVWEMLMVRFEEGFSNWSLWLCQGSSRALCSSTAGPPWYLYSATGREL